MLKQYMDGKIMPVVNAAITFPLGRHEALRNVSQDWLRK